MYLRVGLAELTDRLADDLLARPARTGRERGVADLYPAVQVLGVDRERQGVEQLLHEASLLAEGFLGPLALGDVARQGEDRRLPAKLYATRRGFHRDLGPIASNMRRLEDVDAALQDPLDALRDQGRRLRRVDVGDLHGQKLLAGVAETFARDPVDLDEMAARNVDGHAVAHAVENGPELLLRLAQGLLGLVPGGDVSDRRDGSDDPPAGVAMRSVRVQRPATPTSLGDRVFELARLWLARFHDSAEVLLDACGHDRGEDIARPSAQHAVRSQACHLLHPGVPDDIAKIEVEDDQPFAGAGDDRFHEGVPFPKSGLYAARLRDVLDHRHDPGRADTREANEHTAVGLRVASFEFRRLTADRDEARSLDELRPHLGVGL